MVNVTIKDYQEWLKNNKNVKMPKDGEKLSIFDEQENRALYAQYVNEANLLNQRKAQEKQLAEQKAAALRDNYLASEKAEKKAEDLAKMQGIVTGAAQSDLIDLYARGAAARAGIIQANDSAKNDVFSDYKQAIAKSQASTNEAIADIGNKRALYEEEKQEKKRGEAQTEFSALLNSYVSGDIDKKALKSFYYENEGDLTESQRIAFENAYDAKQDYALEQAITRFENGAIGFEELEKAYERAGDYADADIEDYINKVKAVYEIESMLDKYANDEADFDELRSLYINNMHHLDKTNNADLIQQYQQYVSDHKEAANKLSGDDFDVNVFSTEYTSNAFGDFSDNGESGTKQEEYLDSIVADAKAGKIPIGSLVAPNYGSGNDKNKYLYEYLGNGRFKKTQYRLGSGKSITNIYCPDGYKIKFKGALAEKVVEK